MRVDCQDLGFGEWLEAVAKAGRDVDVVADAMVEAGGAVVHQEMVRRAQQFTKGYSTGALAAHLAQTGIGPVERSGNEHSIEVGLLDLGNAQEGYGERGRKSGRKQYPREFLYGLFLEYGTSSMAAQPFVRPAFDTTKKQQRAAEEQALNESGLV